MAIRDSIRHKLTYEDYLLFPEDGLRHEILDGEHYVTSAPSLWPSSRAERRRRTPPIRASGEGATTTERSSAPAHSGSSPGGSCCAI